MTAGSTLDAIRAEIGALKADKQWWTARRRLHQLSAGELGADEQAYVHQQLALCTYKDPERRRATALHDALELLLGRQQDPASIEDPETAGIAGAIHKRLWELDGRDGHLHDAIAYYQRGADLAATIEPFDPYTTVNAAYFLELQAHERDDATSAGLRDRARALRTDVLERLPAPDATTDWWTLASVVEAHLGRNDVADVAHLRPLIASAAAGTASWERESTANQLAHLARVLVPPFPPAELVALVEVLLPEAHPDAARTFGRRFGVALSGGGFRASLFHLGVLAALAEHDLLRPVEVLSCVSGGSILGAAYYSALADLLERRDDRDISRDDLVEVVRRCLRTVTTAVTKRNVRMEAFFGPVTFWRSVRRGKRSRSRRAGMLYERHLLQPLRPRGSFDHLDGLLIHPSGRPGFRPKQDNWQRAAKVPTLVINATSVGTGRPWRFTAGSLGEPEETDPDVDPLDQLAPIWLDRDPPPAVRGVSVGDAVAASACFPGLFPPVELDGLYPGRTVALVDGGVFDNQGMSGLLAHDCTEIFVSDAGGLMNEVPQPSTFVAKVVLRVNAILLAVVRSASFGQTAATLQSGQVRNLWLVHLMQGLPVTRVDPVGSTEDPPPVSKPVPAAVSVADSGAHPGPGVAIPTDVLRAIADLRTDLDRFTLGEAWALQARGYRLTTEALAARPHPLAADRHEVDWDFRAIEPRLADTARPSPLLDELRAGSKVVFKWFPFGRRVVARSDLER